MRRGIKPNIVSCKDENNSTCCFCGCSNPLNINRIEFSGKCRDFYVTVKNLCDYDKELTTVCIYILQTLFPYRGKGSQELCMECVDVVLLYVDNKRLISNIFFNKIGMVDSATKIYALASTVSEDSFDSASTMEYDRYSFSEDYFGAVRELNNVKLLAKSTELLFKELKGMKHLILAEAMTDRLSIQANSGYKTQQTMVILGITNNKLIELRRLLNIQPRKVKNGLIYSQGDLNKISHFL